MGAAVTKNFTRQDGVIGQGKEVLVYGKKCNMKNYEVDRMFDEFVKLEDQDSHVMSIYDFLKDKKVETGPITDFYFLLFDKRKTGMLPFVDFMLCLWNFLSSNSENLAVYLFLLFDTERSNILDVDEVKYMVNAIWNFNPSHFTEKHLKELSCNQDGLITLAEYMLFMRHYPKILAPVVEIQHKLRKSTIFKRFWETIEGRRTADFSIKPIFLILGKDDPELNMCCLQYLSSHQSTPKKFSEQWKAIIRRKQLTKYKVFEMPMELMKFNPPEIKKTRKKEDKGKIKEYDGIIFQNPYSTAAIASTNPDAIVGREVGEVNESKIPGNDFDIGEIDSVTLGTNLQDLTSEVDGITLDDGDCRDISLGANNPYPKEELDV